MDQMAFARLESKISKLLAEMRQDLRERPLIREFVLLKSAWIYSGLGDDFQYYYEDHVDLNGQVMILQNYGLIEDISDSKTKRYAITEELAVYLEDQPTSLGDQTTFTEPYHCLFHREEKMWTLSFEGKTVHMPDGVGLGYIADLLRKPRIEIKAAELAGALRTVAPIPSHSGLPMADKKTIDTVEAALSERQAELSCADESDLPKMRKLEEEISQLKKYLAEAKDQHGRPRKLAGTAQRSRSSVTNAITRAIDSIAAKHPTLGHHLKISIRTGTSPMYVPAEVPEWHF